MSAESGTESRRWQTQALGPRVASGVVLAPVALGAVWLGGWYLFILVGLVVLAATAEFFGMARRAGIPVLPVPGLLASAALVLFASEPDLAPGGGLVFVVLGIWTFGLSLRPPVEGRLPGLAMTWFGVAYVSGLGVHLLWLREMPRGVELLLTTLAATWAADTFAFLFGVRWGRHRFAPHVSPGKTVEGVAGGLVGAAAVTAAVALLLDPPLLSLSRALLVGAVLGAAAPVGDLVESVIKRNLGAKDASRVIPGHGGFLDRIDSLLVTGPVAFYLFRILLP